MQKSLFKDYVIYNAQDFQKYINTFINDGLLTEPNISVNNNVVSSESFDVLLQGMVKTLESKTSTVNTSPTRYITHTLELTSTLDTSIEYKNETIENPYKNAGYAELKDKIDKNNLEDPYTKEFILAEFEYEGDSLIEQDKNIRESTYFVGANGNSIRKKDNNFMHYAGLNYPLVYDNITRFYQSNKIMNIAASDAMSNRLINKTRSANEESLFKAKSKLFSTLTSSYGIEEIYFNDIDSTTEEVERSITDISDKDYGSTRINRTITLQPNQIIIGANVYLNNLYYRTITNDTESNSIKVGVVYKGYTEDLQPKDTRQQFKVKVIYKES